MTPNRSDAMTADVVRAKPSKSSKTCAERVSAGESAAVERGIAGVTEPAKISDQRRAILLVGEPDPFTGSSNA